MFSPRCLLEQGNTPTAQEVAESPETPERPRQGWEVGVCLESVVWPGYNLNLKLHANHLNSEHFSKAKISSSKERRVLVFETPTTIPS